MRQPQISLGTSPVSIVVHPMRTLSTLMATHTVLPVVRQNQSLRKRIENDGKKQLTEQML
jgi:hypothetical protein